MKLPSKLATKHEAPPDIDGNQRVVWQIFDSSDSTVSFYIEIPTGPFVLGPTIKITPDGYERLRRKCR